MEPQTDLLQSNLLIIVEIYYTKWMDICGNKRVNMNKDKLRFNDLVYLTQGTNKLSNWTHFVEI